MSFNYGPLKNTASRLLKKFGKPITINVLTGQNNDPVTGGKNPTYTDTTGNGVTLAYQGKEIDQSLIRTGDIKLIIEDLDIEPVVGSTTTVSSDLYRVDAVEKVSPGPVNLIYIIRLRK